jgi:3'-phosphoadenosine 5'-phosphosulfate sulfotransferase (PAPS reductase)/FAD synthetase
MLRRILDASAGSWEPIVIFANTGKEDEKTLAFVDEVGRRWGVAIHWIERREGAGYREVTFATASRKGEPFESLIAERGYVPNPGTPYCSTELKFRPARDWMRANGFDDFTAFVGLRADERRRVAKIRGRRVEGGIIETPLADDGICEEDVLRFWREQPFDLEIHPHRGNCDLCFKKSGHKIVGFVDQDPAIAEWWAEQERRTGTVFRLDRPSYTALGAASSRQVRLALLDDGGEPCEMCA